MSAVTAREHHWDSLRAFLMLLGIPYHAAMVYHSRILWDMQSPDKSELLTFVSGVLVSFRMPAFFMVAGYFAAMMLEKRPAAEWLQGRLIRLGIPFLTGLVLLAPLQVALIDLNSAMTGAVPMGAALHVAARDVAHPGFSWIMHLWFLPALLIYSLLLVIGRSWLRGQTLSRLAEVARSACLRAPLASLLVLAMFIAAWDVSISLSKDRMLATDGVFAYLLAHGLDPYLRYLPVFFIGVLIRNSPDVRRALVWRTGWQVPALALLAAALASPLRGQVGEALTITYEAIDGIAAILMSFTVIGIAERFWNRPDARIDRIVDASFTIYLLHHPIIIGLATLFLLADWPPLLEFALTCVIAFTVSYAAHRLLRRSAVALFLFNGVPISRKPGGDARPQTGITTLR